MAQLIRTHYWWLSLLLELIIILAGGIYIFSDMMLSLFIWEILAVLFVSMVISAAWDGMGVPRLNSRFRERAFTFSRFFIFGAIIVGITAAILSGQSGLELINRIAAAVGVVVSWMLLHIGVAQIYQVVDTHDSVFKFPATKNDDGNFSTTCIFPSPSGCHSPLLM
ncbi:MAG: hypothetical protein Q4A82_02660 [Corynebacterium sp.]|nr:hypothetical protein [Corynebacterium sp.]